MVSGTRRIFGFYIKKMSTVFLCFTPRNWGSMMSFNWKNDQWIVAHISYFYIKESDWEESELGSPTQGDPPAKCYPIHHQFLQVSQNTYIHTYHTIPFHIIQYIIISYHTIQYINLGMIQAWFGIDLGMIWACFRNDLGMFWACFKNDLAMF